MLQSRDNDLDTSHLPPQPTAQKYPSICPRGQCHRAVECEGCKRGRVILKQQLDSSHLL